MTPVREPLRQVRWLLLGSLIAHFCAVVFSRGFQHLDEHFQIIEYVSTKLNWTDPSTLPWEYGKQMRPWIQPFFYTGIAKFLILLGIDTPPAINQVLRATTSLLGWLSLVALFDLFKKEGSRLAFFLSAFCFLPYFHTRTTAENFGTSLFVFALWFLLREKRSSPALQATMPLVSGVLFGLAFHARYQLAFSMVGLAAWLFIIARITLRRFGWLVTGWILGLIVGIAIDRWGYGFWTLAPWNYFRVNLLEGAASHFGVDPWWQYLYFLISYTPAYSGVVVGLLSGSFFLSSDGRRHVISWVILPFLLGHFAIGHKEPRFLYPFYVYFPVMVSLLWPRISQWFQTPQTKPHSPRITGLQMAPKWAGNRLGVRAQVFRVAVIGLFLLNCGALFFYTFRREKPQFVLNEYLSETFRGTLHLTGLEGDPFDLDPFYQHFFRPRDFHFHKLPTDLGQKPQDQARQEPTGGSPLAIKIRILLAQLSDPSRAPRPHVPLHFYLHKKGISSQSDNPDPTVCSKIYELLPPWIARVGAQFWVRKINNTLVYRCELEQSKNG